MQGQNKNDLARELLSQIIVHMKYARFIPELQRRETWDELVTRNKEMHIKKYPFLKEEINYYYQWVYDKKVFPSMRSLQFAGKAVEHNPSRIYNCAYLPIDDYRSFSEVMFLLLGGTGVGFSVQNHHVEKLPTVKKPNAERKRRYLIGDSIEGWADAIKILMKSYFYGTSTIDFDFSDIRQKGALLVTAGGKAPGPDPLRICIEQIRKILNTKEYDSQLTSLEVHDIVCHIADSVLAGGIRRSALISLFDADDMEMISCKSGNWWELNPQRGRSNNSAVIVRHKVTKEFFLNIWERIEQSGAGEPGIYLTNDKDWGTNPCCEIALRPYQFCNLCTINTTNVVDQVDLNHRASAAAFIGTLQAGYTNFHYLRDIWRRTTERDALIGVSMTGIASNAIEDLDLKETANLVKRVNQATAEVIGINKSSRCTTVKPEGTASLVAGSSSGIHAWHDQYYIRRVRVGKNEAIYTYLSIYHPELLEDDFFRPQDTAIISIPQASPEGAIVRDKENAIQLLERVKDVHTNWIKPGHRKGENTHNVSATISINKDKSYFTVERNSDNYKKFIESGDGELDEWQAVGEWMWENKDSYNGLSVLPYDGGTYKQAPFETITKEEYESLLESLQEIDLTQVIESQDNTNLKGEAACAAGACEVV